MLKGLEENVMFCYFILLSKDRKDREGVREERRKGGRKIGRFNKFIFKLLFM